MERSTDHHRSAGFAEPHNLEALADSVDLVRDIGRQPALDEWREGGWAPEDLASGRDVVRDYVRIGADLFLENEDSREGRCPGGQWRGPPGR